MNERISCVGVLYANTIGVNEGHIEFCPDSDPATKDEILSWIWAFRPDLADQTLKQDLSEPFKKLVELYRTDEMDKRWDYING